MKIVPIAMMAAALLATAAWHPAAAQTKPHTALDGIKAGKADAADQPLLVPLPPDLTWDDVAGKESLQFSIIPHGKANILFAWGGVTDGDSVRFRAALDAAKPIDEVYFESPGGDLAEGLEIGRLMHARKLATHVKRGHHCVSACNFMFMGGVIRYIDTGAWFEVHMFSDGFANRLRRDLIEPPKSYNSLMKKFPSLDTDRLASFLIDSYPDFTITGDKVKAAMNVVRQEDPNDDDDEAVRILVVRKLIADYNKDHPDKTIDDDEVIQHVVIDEDVKLIQMDSAQEAAAIARFLTEMGMSLKFLTRFANIHNDQPTALTRDELREFNVMNTD